VYASEQGSLLRGQGWPDLMYTPYMTVYSIKSMPKVPNMHCIPYSRVTIARP